MKLSAFHKAKGDEVSLILDYNRCGEYDKIYLSKVFTDTEVPGEVLNLPNIEYGGTGFYYDKAPKLPYSIEHIMPDYHLYDDWVSEKIKAGSKRKEFEYFLDYSIGFLTRGCFRGCSFCVNKNYKRCEQHSPVCEFYDPSRPKLCFLDDNFFSCSEWKRIITEVKELGVPFQFKQGLDERLLNDEKIHEINTWKYSGDFIFAFDNISDREIIEKNLRRIYELYPTWKKHLKFYVFCGYDRNGVWDDDFWIKDIEETFERIRILSRYSALPYIMRFFRCYESKYKGVYTTLAGWCNQPPIFKKFSYEDYCRCKGMGSKYSIYKRDFDTYLINGGRKGAPWRYMEELRELAPHLAKKYFSFTPSSVAEFGADLHPKERYT